MQFEIVPFYTIGGTLAWAVKMHTHEIVSDTVKVKRKLMPDYYEYKWSKKYVFYLISRKGCISSKYYLRITTINMSYITDYVFDSQEKAREAINEYVKNNIKVNSGIPIECLQK